jgi:hypothetical protein
MLEGIVRNLKWGGGEGLYPEKGEELLNSYLESK